MKHSAIYIAFAVLVAACLFLCGEASAEYTLKLWLGGHHTDFSDYDKKAGEYRNLVSGPMPEGGFKLYGNGAHSRTGFYGHIYDGSTANLQFFHQYEDRFSMKVNYTVFERQLQFDLLQNMNGREMLETGAPGGKMMSHEALDTVLDYNYDRHQLESEFRVKLVDKYDLKFVAAHRMIMKKGVDQKLSTTHCFACHVTSKSAEVNQWSNQINVGLEAKKNDISLGYVFSYRLFESKAEEPMFYYPDARHPVNGGSVGEFGSRLIFDNGNFKEDILPATRKFSNKLNFKIAGSKRVLSGAFKYSKTINDEIVDLDIVTTGGVLNFRTVVSPRLWMFVNGAVSRTVSNDIWYDIPAWRIGGAGGDLDYFDHYRTSSLDRLYGRGDIRAVYKASGSAKLDLLLGYEHTRRYDYPNRDSETATNVYYGEGAFKIRGGMDYTLSGSYRLELISDPFQNYRGLFEARGRGVITPVGGAPQVYYYQREDLRYGWVTPLPTIKHKIELDAQYRLSQAMSVNASLDVGFDNNDDLEEIEVEHSSFKPSIGIDLKPSSKWTLAGGFVYQKDRSRGPIAITMFDG